MRYCAAAKLFPGIQASRVGSYLQKRVTYFISHPESPRLSLLPMATPQQGRPPLAGLLRGDVVTLANRRGESALTAGRGSVEPRRTCAVRRARVVMVTKYGP